MLLAGLDCIAATVSRRGACLLTARHWTLLPYLALDGQLLDGVLDDSVLAGQQDQVTDLHQTNYLKSGRWD